MGFTVADFYFCEDAPDITGIDIDPCDEDPCRFKPGDTPVVTISFVARTGAENANFTQSYSQGGWTSFPSHDVCGDGIECPIVKDQEYKMNHALVTDGIIPAGDIDFEVKLESDTYVLICVRFPLRILD